MQKYALVFIATCLAGCGSLAPNTDIPQGVYLGAGNLPDIADERGVKLIEGLPPAGIVGVPVSGTSCKNKIWGPAPERGRAIAVMKREAKKAGMNTVYLQSVGDDPSALTKNCWSAITAAGIAVKG